MVTRYDATTRAEQERFAYWHEVICRLFPRAAASRRGDDVPFSARLEQRGLGTIGISDIRCSAVRYQRDRRDQRLDDKEEFLVSLMLEGEARLDQGGRSTVQRPGDLVLYDAAQPFDYRFSSYRILLTTIPRRSLLSRLPEAERRTAIALPAATPLGRLAGELMSGANTLEPATRETVASRVGLTLLDVVCAAFEQHTSDEQDAADRQALLVRRAKAHVRSRIDDPDLDVESIASAMHVSARTLSRAFAGEGETVIRWLWRERLRRGHALLTEGRIAQVSDAALGCGFSCSSHFARMFRQVYGIAPHVLLRTRADSLAGSDTWLAGWARDGPAVEPDGLEDVTQVVCRR